VGFEDKYQEGEYKKDGLEQLRAFHQAVLEQPLLVLELEKNFELPVENNVILKGRIDQVNSLGGLNALRSPRRTTWRSSITRRARRKGFGRAERPATEHLCDRRKRDF